MWRAWSLRSASLLTITAIEAGIIAAVATLLCLSLQRNGFAAVKDPGADSADTSNTDLWSQGLLWTALPTLLVTLFRLYHESVVTAFVNEAPYAELYRTNGASVRKSLLLDYRTVAAWKAWFIAFKNGHCVHGTSMLLGWTVSLFLVPFSARLMAPAQTYAVTSITASLITDFRDSALNRSVNYRPIFDAVSGTRLFDGEPPEWTDGVYAFPAIELPAEGRVPNEVSVAYKARAYSARLDCVEIPADGYTVSSTNARIRFAAVDRGCEIQIDGSVLGNSEEYLKVNSITACTASTGYSRLVVFAGLYNANAPNLLTDLSFISCTPIYEQTRGTLNKTLNGPTSSLLFLADQDAPDRIQSQYWTQFETGLNSISDINAQSPEFTTTFGGLVLAMSRKLYPDEHLRAESLMTAISILFTTAFAFTAATIGFQAISPQNIEAALTVSSHRLHIVRWIAYSFFTIFALLIIESVVLLFYLRRHPTHLTEEPQGLLSHAELVMESDSLSRVLAQARADYRYDTGKVVEYLNKYTDTKKTKCWVSKGQGSGRDTVLMEDPVPRERPKIPWFKSWFGFSKGRRRTDT